MAVLALVALFAAAVVVAATVAVVAWRRRREAPGFAAIATVAAGATWWSALSLVTLFTHDVLVMTVVISCTYAGVFLSVVGWWVTARALSNRFWRLRRRAVLILAVEPVLCTVALVTNPFHHLFITELRPTSLGGALAASFGPLFWPHAAYSYAVIVFSGVTIVRMHMREAGRYRGYLVATLSSTPSLIVNIVGTLSHGRLIDLTAVGFALGAPVLYWVVKSQTVPALAPVAHRELFRNMSDVMIVVDAGRRLIDLNPAAERLLGQVGVVVASSFDTPELPAAFAGLLTESSGEYVVTDVGGSGIDLSVRVSEVRDGQGERAGHVLVARDITEQNRQRRDLERANDQLRSQLITIEALQLTLAEQASRDYLTDLFNRRHLMTRLGEALASRATFAVALLDIDFFKQINDRYGHNAGDDVLIHVANLLRAAAGPDDVAARHGGEEFALVLAGADADTAVRRIDALRRELAARPVRVAGEDITVTFSAGIALGTGLLVGATDVLHQADLGLYAAKANGRNRVELTALAPG